MFFDEVKLRRLAIVVAGLLIWILHTFVRIALFPLLMLEGETYFWASYGMMAVLTGICAYYLLVVLREGKIVPALGLAVTWLIVYALAEYGRHYYSTHELQYPLNTLPRLLISVSFIPLAAIACGVILTATMRKKPWA